MFALSSYCLNVVLHLWPATKRNCQYLKIFWFCLPSLFSNMSTISDPSECCYVILDRFSTSKHLQRLKTMCYINNSIRFWFSWTIFWLCQQGRSLSYKSNLKSVVILKLEAWKKAPRVSEADHWQWIDDDVNKDSKCTRLLPPTSQHQLSTPQLSQSECHIYCWQ